MVGIAHSPNKGVPVYSFNWLAAWFESMMPGWGIPLAALALILGALVVVGFVKRALG